MPSLLEKLLNEKPYLLADGATGTNLFGMGLVSGDAPELWNAEQPDKVAEHYQTFIDAGSDIVLTNTFGGNAYRLKLHKAEQRVEELNIAAAEILADRVRASGREIVVAGSMGPTGEILQPTGDLPPELAAEAFAQQAAALKQGGVDVLWIETISSAEELLAAVQGAATTGLPVVTTLSIDTNGRTMMGLSGADIVELQSQLAWAPLAFGTNCGLGASEVVAAISNMRQAAAQYGVTPVIVAKANCGIPQWEDGEIHYNGTPQVMARFASMAIDAGARIIGGCCGTKPEHIRLMREALDHYTPGPTPDIERITKELGEITPGARAQLQGDGSVQGGAVGGRGRRQSRRRR